MSEGPIAPASRPRRARRIAGVVVAMSAASGALAGAVVGVVMDSDAPSGTPATTSLTITTSAGSPTATTLPGAYPDVRAVVARVRQSVVAIDATVVSSDPRGRAITGTASGTGIVLTAGGMIATNAHVVAGALKIVVSLPDGSKVDGTLIGVRTAQDLAVVYVNRSDLVPADIGRSGDMQVGDFVVAMGNALALDGGPTASLGIVSALDRTITTDDGASYSHLLQTDAAINSGDSGGPLVNAAGQVIGINAAAALTAENIGFAIAIDIALPLLIDLYTG
jgi:S1-C subfamily serine protease